VKEELYWYWINNINGIGRQTIRFLIDTFGSPEAVYSALDEEVLFFLRKQDMRENYVKSKDGQRIEESYERLSREGIKFLYPTHEQYPGYFKQIPDSPMGLYLKGNLWTEGRKAVAIIGARQCSRYGLEMARFFGRELAKCGVTIISGLARGVDGMAHTGALEAEGYTIGVVGGGIDQVYPRENYHLFMQMEEKGGILSESNIGVKPVAGLFPQRNRLIAGLCDGILVVEAREKSGTFITVDQGLEQGKEIFSIPGRIMDSQSVGCNNLIKLGAHMVTEVEDILEVLHMEEGDTPKLDYKDYLKDRSYKMSLAPLEKMVYSCLRIEPRYLDDIIKELRIAPQDVCRALNRMILAGIVSEPSRNYYAIKL
jgi:DNA processing protein